jgi:hypothetical protein
VKLLRALVAPAALCGLALAGTAQAMTIDGGSAHVRLV